VAAAFGKVLLQSQGAASTEVGDDELAEAIARYERGVRASKRAAPTPTIPAPRRRTPKATKTEPEDESSNEKHVFNAPPPLWREDDPTQKEFNLRSQMNDANRLYDKGQYEDARDAALEILEGNPKNVRMLRIVVSSSCIMGEPEPATKHYLELPRRDQRQMARRCKRYGVEFDE
jgi:hypothetical protein